MWQIHTSHSGLRILQWMVACCGKNIKFLISALMQSTAESTDCCSKSEQALREGKIMWVPSTYKTEGEFVCVGGCVCVRERERRGVGGCFQKTFSIGKVAFHSFEVDF